MRCGYPWPLALILVFAWCGVAAAGPPVYEFEVVATYRHDPTAYTQGLLWANGFLFESTGRHGHSTLRRVRLADGEVLQQVHLPDRYFAEGLARVGDRLFQLTWKAGVGFIYDIGTFERVGTFRYPGQGWGLVYVDGRLIMSDGSAVLRVIDPESMQRIDQIRVTVNGQPLPRLNELEMVRGQLWANVYPTDLIVRIDPASGRVVGVIDASGLRAHLSPVRKVGALNGIAYDPVHDRIFVTGKLWPRLFQVRVIRKQPGRAATSTTERTR